MGAVEENTRIHFKIILPRSLGCSKAELNIKHDFDGDWTYCNMFWCGIYSEGFEVWECHYTTEKIGLYWHGFRLQTNEGERYVNPAGPEKKSEICRSTGASWQITCYKKGFQTPKWPVGGVMYQIFPDRFCYSGNKKKTSPKTGQFMKTGRKGPSGGQTRKGKLQTRTSLWAICRGLRKNSII